MFVLVFIAFCPFSVSDHPCASLAGLTDQNGDDASLQIRLGFHWLAPFGPYIRQFVCQSVMPASVCSAGLLEAIGVNADVG
jgi:hypothetical protein